MQTFFKSFSTNGRSASRRFLITAGINLIIIGVLIILFPKVLAYFVAGLFFLLGFGMLVSGFRAGKNRNFQSNIIDQETIYYQE